MVVITASVVEVVLADAASVVATKAGRSIKDDET